MTLAGESGDAPVGLATHRRILAYLDHLDRQGRGCEQDDDAGDPKLAHMLAIDAPDRGL
jgi:hypothetical protein